MRYGGQRRKLRGSPRPGHERCGISSRPDGRRRLVGIRRRYPESGMSWLPPVATRLKHGLDMTIVRD